MTNEIVRFMEIIDDDFKKLGVKPKEGLHILLKLKEQNNEWLLDNENYQYEIYSKKTYEISDFLKKCMNLSQSAWYFTMNKTFDMGIHTCSPYCVAFKKEFLSGGGKNVKDKEKNRNQITNRFKDRYFKNCFKFVTEDEKERLNAFEKLFTNTDSNFNYITIIEHIQNQTKFRRDQISQEIQEIKKIKSKSKEIILDNKTKIDVLNQEMEKVIELNDSSYIIFYLDEFMDKYKEAHDKYLEDNLFNTSNYNSKSNHNSEVFGTSDFYNRYNQNMPFLMHKSASFDISGRISFKDAKVLYEFQQLLPLKILPNPLPIFIFEEELQKGIISLFKENQFNLSYKEIIEKLWDKYKNDFGNYYLLFFQNTKEGIVFKDFDFISKFEYELKTETNDNWEIKNLFEIKDFKSSVLKNYPKLKDVFSLENHVFQVLIGNKYNKISYFKDFDIEEYKDRNSTPNKNWDNSFNSFSKYRNAVYDYVYKSKRNSINLTTFYEMVFSSVKDYIKQNNAYAVRERLNIWFSLYEKFSFNNINGEPDMASKLIEYQKFVESLCNGNIDFEVAKDQHFAFATGQVIDYIRNKSKSTDKSYLLLEPYLQQSECSGLKKAISNEFSRFKHENFSRKFENVASFVLSYETDTNMKKLLPELLAGIFSKNQLYSDKEYLNQSINKQEILEDE